MATLGLVLPQYDTSWEDLVSVARAAESAGFHALWLEDHFRPWAHEERGSAFECWTALSALSQVTSRVRLGTLVTCASYRDPALLAKMAATFDVFSRGRLVLGIGAGWYGEEYEAYGVPFLPPGERVTRLAETIRIVRAMWDGTSPTLRTKHHDIRDAFCNPRPLQRPAPPIWVGGGGPRILRIAARHADGWNYGAMSPAQFAEKLAELRRSAEQAGRDPAAITPSLELFVLTGRTAAEARERSRAFDAARPAGQGIRHLIRDAYAGTRIEGEPQRCIEPLRAYVAAGVEHFTLVFPGADAASIRLFGERVAPALGA